MDRYNHILKRPLKSAPKSEMTALEKFQAIETWYQSGHFESIIEELKNYLKPIKEIQFGKDAGWFVRASFFEVDILFSFTVTSDKGTVMISRGRTRNQPIIFEINSQGEIIGESDKNRAEVILNKIFEILVPFTFPEPKIAEGEKGVERRIL